MNDVMPGSAEDFGGFEKSELFDSEREGWTFGTHRSQTSSLRRGPHVMGDRWKSHHRKIVHLSSLCRNL